LLPHRRLLLQVHTSLFPLPSLQYRTLYLTLAQMISITCYLFCRVEFFTNPCLKVSDFFYASSSPPSISSHGSSPPSPHLLTLFPC
jgi:hypothetical protein